MRLGSKKMSRQTVGILGRAVGCFDQVNGFSSVSEPLTFKKCRRGDTHGRGEPDMFPACSSREQKACLLSLFGTVAIYGLRGRVSICSSAVRRDHAGTPDFGDSGAQLGRPSRSEPPPLNSGRPPAESPLRPVVRQTVLPVTYYAKPRGRG